MTTGRNELAAGLFLILVGVGLFLHQLVDGSGAVVLAVIGIGLLGWFAMTRRYGFLIAGMVLIGLAVGVGLEEAGRDPSDSAVLLGLAAAFVAIYLVGAATKVNRSWWPLVPGGILAVIALSQLFEDSDAAEIAARGWPVLLIVGGAVLLLRDRIARPR
ncbi:MAG TPA: hypothetical protein VM052_03285 [Candidatus Limnocylindrales bacterium]|nr:hypothetical protein [Candidatus Limnocylindrales bacterium]